MQRHQSASVRERLQRARRNGRGAVAVEFGIIAPLFLLLVFGIIDFGYMFNRDTLVNNLTRDAARSASIGEDFNSVRTQIVTDLVRVGLCKGVGGASPQDAQCPEGTQIKIGFLNDQSSMQNLDQWDAESGNVPPGGWSSAVYPLPSTTANGHTTFSASGTVTNVFDADVVRGTVVSVELNYNHHWLTPLGGVCRLFSGSCVGDTIHLDKTAKMTRE